MIPLRGHNLLYQCIFTAEVKPKFLLSLSADYLIFHQTHTINLQHLDACISLLFERELGLLWSIYIVTDRDT